MTYFITSCQVIMDDRVLQIILEAKDQASEQIKNMGNQVQKTAQQTADMSKAFQIAGGVLIGVGTAGVGILTDLASAAKAHETAMASVDAQLKNVSVNTLKSKESFDALKKTADDLTDTYLKLGFADHETELAFAQTLRVTKDETKAKEMLADAADLARMKHISLTDASLALTKAYEGSTKMLKQFGIEVDKGAKGMEVLAAVHTATSGQAQAFASTYAGAMEILKVNIEKFKATLGERLLPTITTFLNSITGMVVALNQLKPSVYNSIIQILSFVTAFSLVSGSFLEAIVVFKDFGEKLFALTPTGRATIVILGIIAALGWVIYNNWNTIGPILQDISTKFGFLNVIWNELSKTVGQFYNQYLLPLIQTFIELALPVIQQISAEFQSEFLPIWLRFQAILVTLKPILEAIGIVIGTVIVAAIAVVGVALLAILDTIRLLMPVFAFVFDFITAVITLFAEIVKFVSNIIIEAFNEVKEKGLSGLMAGFFNTFIAIGDFISGKIDWFIKMFTHMKDSIVGIFSTMANAIMSALHSIKFPHINIGYGSTSVGGRKIDYPTIGVDWYEKGGWVNQTGLAVVHQGEYVLSRDMLAGRAPIASSVTNNNNKSASINVEQLIVQDQGDIDLLAQRLALQFNLSR